MGLQLSVILTQTVGRFNIWVTPYNRENIFVYKLFLSLNIWDFSLFFTKKLQPLTFQPRPPPPPPLLKKVTSSLSQQLRLKIEILDPVKSWLFENLVGGSASHPHPHPTPPHLAERGPYTLWWRSFAESLYPCAREVTHSRDILLPDILLSVLHFYQFYLILPFLLPKSKLFFLPLYFLKFSIHFVFKICDLFVSNFWFVKITCSIIFREKIIYD